MSEFRKVLAASELPPGKALSVDFAGERVALFNVAGRIYAIGDACTHRGGSLSEGSVEGTEVTCPLHGAVFDLATGEAKGPPASVERGEIRLDG